MGSTKTFHALYNDDDILLSAVKKIKEKHYDIEEVYTPFPVHGLDKVMGLEPTRIAIAAFIYGCIGITVATLMMNYIMIVDWPQNIGGKPSFSFIENLPAFVPIMFGVAMGIGFDKAQVAIPVALAASCAFMLPVATPPNAIVYGSEKFTISEMMKAGFYINIIGIVVVTIFAAFVLPIVL